MQLEDTNEKMTIRNRLSHHISEIANDRHGSDINMDNIECVVLSGTQCRFEHTLNTELSFLAPFVKINYVGVERVNERAHEAFRERANNEHIAKCQLNDIFRYGHKKHNAGWVSIDKSIITPCGENPKNGHNFNVVWADYCCEPSMELFKDSIDIAAGMKVGYFSMTFCVKSRRGGKSDARLIKRFRAYGKADNAEQAVINGVNHTIKKAFKGKNTCWKKMPILVCDISYAGGASGVKMITLSFTIGLPKTSCTPIFERIGDRVEKAKKDNAILQNLKKKTRDWTDGRKSSNKLKISDIKKTIIRNTAKIHEKLWNGYDKAKKLEIVKPLGVSVGSLGCTIAHFHGKLKLRKAIVKANG